MTIDRQAPGGSEWVGSGYDLFEIVTRNVYILPRSFGSKAALYTGWIGDHCLHPKLYGPEIS